MHTTLLKDLLFALGIVSIASLTMMTLHMLDRNVQIVAERKSAQIKTVSVVMRTSMPLPVLVRPGLPARLIIPGIYVDTVPIALGLTKDGFMDVPKSPKDAAWYELSARPGEIGSAVISGHYGWKDNIPALFDDLRKLQIGDKVYSVDDKGATTTFVVVKTRTLKEGDDASEVFASSDGKVHLNLITCGGTWDKVRRIYSDRLVIFTEKAP